PKRLENWLQQETYGATHEFSLETMEQYGKVLLILAAGDGSVSHDEWLYFVERSKAMGGEETLFDIWSQYDYKAADLKTEVKKFWDLVGGKALAFLYDAILISSADGYQEGEKKALRNAAEVCGISEAVVRQIEELVAHEASLRALRVALLFPEPTSQPHK